METYATNATVRSGRFVPDDASIRSHTAPNKDGTLSEPSLKVDSD